VLLIGSVMLQLLALGDSYTIGEAVPEAERWPVQLVAMLARRGITLAPPLIIAKTGWTTDELSAAIAERSPSGTYQLVTLLIGVNNQYRGRDSENYREEFRALLNQAIAFADRRPDRVIVLSIPDWGVTPAAEGRDRAKIAEEIDHFNRINWEETTRAGARYVDVTPISRRAAHEPRLVADDGLHPSGEMYRLWTEKVLPEAIAALR
jgi:lysophospholipase L1-like esterase